jgi:hypothetical protein
VYKPLIFSGIHFDSVVIKKFTTAHMKVSAVCVLLQVPCTEVYSFRSTGNAVQGVNAVDLGEL